MYCLFFLFVLLFVLMFNHLHRPVALRPAPMGIQLEPARIIILLISIITISRRVNPP